MAKHAPLIYTKYTRSIVRNTYYLVLCYMGMDYNSILRTTLHICAQSTGRRSLAAFSALLYSSSVQYSRNIMKLFLDKPHARGAQMIWYPYCLLYTSPSPRDRQKSRMPSSA